MRAAILVLAILLPAVAWADDEADEPDSQAAASSAQAPQGTARPPQQPPPPQERRRRRGSMVGYIDDATIDDHVRVRFDAGTGIDIPDRAEFFYAQCGCNFAGAPGPGAAGPGDLVTSLNYQELTVDGQYAVTNRLAVFAIVPIRFLQPQGFLGATFTPPLGNTFMNASGLSDIRIGAKAAIVSNEDVTVSGQFKGIVSSGDAKQGLGTDHGSLEFSLLVNGNLSDRARLEAEFGDWHPTGGSIAPNGQTYSGDVLFYGIGPSYEVVRTPNVSLAPVVELVAWHVLGGQQQNGGNLEDAEGTNVVNLKIGARVTFNDRGSIYGGWGRALTDSVWYKNIVRVEYRYSF